MTKKEIEKVLLNPWLDTALAMEEKKFVEAYKKTNYDEETHIISAILESIGDLRFIIAKLETEKKNEQ